MEWFWVKTGIRWFTFSRWFAKKMIVLNAYVGREDGVEQWQRLYKQADLGLGLALAKDLGRAIRNAIKAPSKPLTQEQLVEQHRQFAASQ